MFLIKAIITISDVLCGDSHPTPVWSRQISQLLSVSQWLQQPVGFNRGHGLQPHANHRVRKTSHSGQDIFETAKLPVYTLDYQLHFGLSNHPLYNQKKDDKIFISLNLIPSLT